MQDITEEEAEKEGLRAKHNIVGGCHSAREALSELWDKLNAKRGYPWDDNPWIWVYGFERIEKPE